MTLAAWGFPRATNDVDIDLFVPSIPFYRSVEACGRKAPFRDTRAKYLSPEDLAVFKMLSFRTKDVLDVERLLGFLGSAFDSAYVRASLVEIVGEKDDRIARWDRLVSDTQRR